MSSERVPDKALERLTKKLAKGAGIVFLGQIAGRLLGFALQVTLGRLLGASGYGLYALSISTLEFGARLSQLGLANGLVRYVAVYRAEENPARLKGTLLTGFSIGGGAALVGALGLFIAAPWIAGHLFHNPALTWPLRIATLALPVYNLGTLAQSALRGLQRMEAFTLAAIARSALTLAFSGALVALGRGVLGAVGGYWMAALATLFLSLWLLSRNLPPSTLASAPERRTRELLRFSLPLYVAGFSFLLMTRTDILMLGYFGRPEEVGAYRAAVALARLMTFGLGAINTAFAPMIADLYTRNDLEGLSMMYRVGTRWGVLLSLVVAIPLLLFPREVLRVYGAGFTVAVWALVGLVAFQLINAGVGSVGFMLQMSGHQDWVLGNNLFTAILNVGLNLWWIPTWGVLGAALATGTALALNNILGMVEVFYLLKMHPFDRNYAWLGLAVTPSIVVYWVLHQVGLSWWWGLPLTWLAFIIGFVGLGLSRHDRVVMRAVWKKIRGKTK